ncbi:MAG: hypothetical protein M1522_08670 [Actinobacteria bacterium]|nr:hypothetical protein [Actinomycetota bacterium]
MGRGRHARPTRRVATFELGSGRGRAQTLNEEDENARTYAVVWYCEVNAVSERAAVKKARKFLAPGCWDNWEPLLVAVVGQTRGWEKGEP